MLVSVSVASRKQRSPVGRITASGRMPILGLPEIRRGSLTFVTRPSTIAPAGMRVWPLSTTGWLRLPRKGSPGLLLNVARVVSSRTIKAVPAGTGVAVCAAIIVGSSRAASSRTQGRAINFFEIIRVVIVPPSKNPQISLLTLDQVAVRDKRQAVQVEPLEIRGRRRW